MTYDPYDEPDEAEKVAVSLILLVAVLFGIAVMVVAMLLVASPKALVVTFGVQVALSKIARWVTREDKRFLNPRRGLVSVAAFLTGSWAAVAVYIFVWLPISIVIGSDEFKELAEEFKVKKADQ